MSTGLAQACLDLTVDFVNERSSMGRKLAAHQYIAFKVADMAAATATARTVTYDACWKLDHGYDFAQEVCICKFVASEIANKVSYIATQLRSTPSPSSGRPTPWRPRCSSDAPARLTA